MKVTNTEKTKLGIFVILTGAVLIIALYFIGKKQNLFGNTFKVTAVFSNVNGLKLGNNVRFSGINVGTVRNILMVDDSTICVDMIIDEEIRRHMKRSAVAVVGSDGLVGSMVVNIFPGGSRGDILQEGDTIQSIKRKSSADMMSTLSVTNDNAAELSKELLKITKSINEGDGTLGLLLNDEEMGSDLKETFQNLNQASVEASKAINEVKDFVNAVNDEDNLINVLVRDTVSARQLRNMISNLEKSSEDIDLVIRNLNDFIVDIRESEGTLNYLVSDTILVQDIGETVKNIKKGSEMLNENLEALRHNTFFKGYFRKQEKERLKEEKRQKKLQE
ncbi:MlaD family protein [Lutimonas zeaxanthinifaciens]|uniref:MlaD family protein n=1 Tax=Lutimonas zeaxanthinifaciens TaxID=3060215 RepID=UPI00265CA2A5|nr:MlaD family protein [Lutimonas sp. YSD2104]WKK64894.1 MlaD family protein [Lutimonas sp. YSD2104]